jgi:drug/metabolite transporter (DMT)-like permease
MLLGSTLLFLLVCLRKIPIPLDRIAIRQYLTVGILNFSLSYSLTYSGTRFIYSNIASLLWASLPIVMALSAHVFLPAESLNLRKGLGISIGFGGVVLIFAGYGYGESENLLLGMFLVMLAVLASVWPSIYLKRQPARARPIALNAMAIGIGGFLTFITSLLLEDQDDMLWNVTNIGIIVYLAVFATVIAWVAYFYLLERIAVVQLSFVGFFAPLIATFLGIIFLGELLPPTVFLGAFLILFGIFMSDARRYRRMIRRS